MPPLHARNIHISSIFRAAQVVLHKIWEGRRHGVCGVHPDAVLKVRERWIGWKWYGTLCNHRVMEPERDKDVPNKHNPHALSWSNALRLCVRVFARAYEQQEQRGGVTKCVSVFWVCLLGEWLVSESAVPVCHGLRGPWAYECSSSSPPLSFLSLLPLLGPAQHLLLAVGTGQGFLSN